MKKTLSFILLALCSIFVSLPANAKANKQTVTFYVAGLHCQSCVEKVEKAIAYEKGVKDIVCSLENKTVVVTFDANKTNVPTLQKAFAKIGKPATTKPETKKCSHEGTCSADGSCTSTK